MNEKQSQRTSAKSKQHCIPPIGDANYLTSTQRRNRRKRRAKQDKNKLNNGSISNSLISNDPSMKFISQPTMAPVVLAARKYFHSIPIRCQSITRFHVHVGPLYEWRTVSKLAVRSEENTKRNKKCSLAIGLFLPNSHTLIPLPQCRAHHPSINNAIQCVTYACHELGILPYQETGAVDSDKIQMDHTNSRDTDCIATQKGLGQLRYVAVNIERKTGAAQITLVWNGKPNKDHPIKDAVNTLEGDYENVHDASLKRLVRKIISISNAHEETNIFSNEHGKHASHQNTRSGASMTNDLPPRKRRRRGDRVNPNSAKVTTGTDTVPPTNLTFMARIKGIQTESTDDKKSLVRGNTLNLHSLWINYNHSWKHSNAIFEYDSSCWKRVYGPPAIIEYLNLEDRVPMRTILESKKNHRSPYQADSKQQPCPLAISPPPRFPIPLHFPPNVFRQGNLDAFSHIVARIRERVLEMERASHAIRTVQNANFNSTQSLPSCVELYGGVGTIGLHLSDIVSALVSSDDNPNNAKCFYDSVVTFPQEIQSRLEYKKKNAASMIATESALFQKCDVLILDPPRKGLDREVVQYLCTFGWQTIQLVVYVSCGFPAFQRDCDALMGSKHWNLEFAEGYLLFPGSDAIETLAFFVPVSIKRLP